MPHITFVYPCVGRFKDTRYVRSWQMQPLAIAVLSSLTPPHWTRSFFDDRLERIDYAQPTDLAAISIETFTARRGYQIAESFRRRNVPIIMGGYHATFCPEEVLEHADAVCIGQAEGVWKAVLEDVEVGRLKRTYTQRDEADFSGVIPDRSIFNGKKYFKIALVETGRGCRFRCHFCSISAFYRATHQARSVTNIIADIRQTGAKVLFFVDDNAIADIPRAKELFAALIPLGIHWIGQASINVAGDPDLLGLIAQSGCLGLLIGFESLNATTLETMGKYVNQSADYAQALAALRAQGISVYGTFLFGNANEQRELLQQTVHFAIEHKLFLAAFNHVVPFPGTPLYDQCAHEGSLIRKAWWLSERYRFGQLPFHPPGATASDVQKWCHEARREFFSLPSILRRALDLSANCRTVRKAKVFFALNLLMRREISQKRGLPLGVHGERDA